MEEFERLLKDKMEHASLKEVFPEFDKGEEWAMLEEKLHPVKKRRYLLAWSHAAAILIGILGGWFLLKEFRPQNTTGQITINVPASQKNGSDQSTPQVADIVKKETVSIEKIKARHEPIGKNSYNLIRTDTINIALVKNNKLVNNLQQNKDSNYSISPQPLHTILTVVKHRQQALSMLDVMNEDRQFMINEQPEKIQGSKIFNQLQHQIANTEGFAASNDQPYALRLLFTKK